MAQTVLVTSRPAHQAFQILYLGFIVAPFLAGADKFTHFLTNWDQYLAPVVAGVLPVSGHTFMLFVGIVEMSAAVLVAARPRIGAYVCGRVALWHHRESAVDPRVLRRRVARFRVSARSACPRSAQRGVRVSPSSVLWRSGRRTEA